MPPMKAKIAYDPILRNVRRSILKPTNRPRRRITTAPRVKAPAHVTTTWVTNTAESPPPAAIARTGDTAEAVPNATREPFSQSKRPKASSTDVKNELMKEHRKIS